MKIKKIAGLGAAFLTSGLILGACGVSNTVSNYDNISRDTTSITFFGNKYEPENVIVIEDIISGFMEENPDIRVSYESLKGTDYYDALLKRMDAGKGDDVFMVNHDTILKLEEKGQMADLSGMSSIGDFTEQMLGQMDSNGSIYWVPTTVSVFGLYCNMDLLGKHKQPAPGNLKEWESVCDYFLEQGITPVIANNDISLKTLAIGRGFYALYQENRQAEEFDKIDRGEEKLSVYLGPGFSVAAEFIGKGYIDADAALVTKKTSDDLEEFVKGESPFMLTGAWAAGRVKSMNPDFDFQVFPYPVLEDGAMAVINADTRLSVNASSQHPEAALRFVEYFTKPENIQKFAAQQSSFSPLKQGRPSSVKEIEPLISCYQSGRTVLGTDRLLDLPIWELTAQVSEKLLSGESLSEAMDWMDQRAFEEGEHSGKK